MAYKDKRTNQGSPDHGRRANQRLKHFFVLRFLQKNSDEDHTYSGQEIAKYLTDLEIPTERRSVYNDIKEINKIMLMLEEDLDLKEAEAEIEKRGDAARYIVYDKNKKGFYVNERRYGFDEIRLAAESIYDSKFLTKRKAAKLVKLLCSFVTDRQASEIQHDVFKTDRTNTNYEYTFDNVSDINSAMSRELFGEKHIPEKISFKYIKTSINDMKQQVERRQGKRYIVSPYALLLNNGNYYMLGFDDKAQKILTYRVDRMRDIQFLEQPRDGADAFSKINMKTYTQRVFSMFEGDQTNVVIRFINPLLDTVIERFGTTGVSYSKADDTHFNVSTQVDVSDQFFGWLCGFGKKAKIMHPQTVADQFVEYLDKIKSNY